MISEPSRTTVHRSRLRYLSFAALLATFVIVLRLRADEPYARSRDYDLQHSKISLRFDIDQKKVLGEVALALDFARRLQQNRFGLGRPQHPGRDSQQSPCEIRNFR